MSEHGISIDDIESLGLEDFDAAEYLTSDEAVAAYLTDILDANDAGLLAVAVGLLGSVPATCHLACCRNYPI